MLDFHLLTLLLPFLDDSAIAVIAATCTTFRSLVWERISSTKRNIILDQAVIRNYYGALNYPSLPWSLSMATFLGYLNLSSLRVLLPRYGQLIRAQDLRYMWPLTTSPSIGWKRERRLRLIIPYLSPDHSPPHFFDHLIISGRLKACSLLLGVFSPPEQECERIWQLLLASSLRQEHWCRLGLRKVPLDYISPQLLHAIVRTENKEVLAMAISKIQANIIATGNRDDLYRLGKGLIQENDLPTFRVIYPLYYDVQIRWLTWTYRQRHLFNPHAHLHRDFLEFFVMEGELQEEFFDLLCGQEL